MMPLRAALLPLTFALAACSGPVPAALQAQPDASDIAFVVGARPDPAGFAPLTARNWTFDCARGSGMPLTIRSELAGDRQAFVVEHTGSHADSVLAEFLTAQFGSTRISVDFTLAYCDDAAIRQLLFRAIESAGDTQHLYSGTIHFTDGLPEDLLASGTRPGSQTIVQRRSFAGN